MWFIGIIFTLWFLSELLSIVNNNNYNNISDGQEIIFKSVFSRGGDPTAPEKLIFSGDLVTWKKNRGIKWFYTYTDTNIIPLKHVTGMKLHSKLIGCDLEIIGQGYQKIYARHFRGSDASRIRKIISSHTESPALRDNNYGSTAIKEQKW